MYLDTRIEEHREKCRKYHALLNGFEVDLVIAANEEEGWIDFLVRGKSKRTSHYNCKVVLDTRLDKTYPFVVARAHGHVELVKVGGDELLTIGANERVS